MPSTPPILVAPPLKVVSLSEIQQIVSHELALEAARIAFVSLSAGKVSNPPVQQLLFPPRSGETCIKSGHIHSSPYYTVKVASGFRSNTSEGVKSGSGVILVFNAKYGWIEGVLNDDGWLTDFRTAAAGGLVFKTFMGWSIESDEEEKINITVLGSGVQAMMQVDAMCNICPSRIGSINIWSRTSANAIKLVDELNAVVNKGGNINITAHETVKSACGDADVILTCTSSTTPILTLKDIPVNKPKLLVLAIGADTPGKNEIGQDLIDQILEDKEEGEDSGTIVTDTFDNFYRLGEGQAFDADHVIRKRAVLLGDVLRGPVLMMRTGVVLVGLSGCGAQDAAIGGVVFQNLEKEEREKGSDFPSY